MTSVLTNLCLSYLPSVRTPQARVGSLWVISEPGGDLLVTAADLGAWGDGRCGGSQKSIRQPPPFSTTKRQRKSQRSRGPKGFISLALGRGPGRVSD